MKSGVVRETQRKPAKTRDKLLPVLPQEKIYLVGDKVSEYKSNSKCISCKKIIKKEILQDNFEKSHHLYTRQIKCPK